MRKPSPTPWFPWLLRVAGDLEIGVRGIRPNGRPFGLFAEDVHGRKARRFLKRQAAKRRRQSERAEARGFAEAAANDYRNAQRRYEQMLEEKVK